MSETPKSRPPLAAYEQAIAKTYQEIMAKALITKDEALGAYGRSITWNATDSEAQRTSGQALRDLNGKARFVEGQRTDSVFVSDRLRDPSFVHCMNGALVEATLEYGLVCSLAKHEMQTCKACYQGYGNRAKSEAECNRCDGPPYGIVKFVTEPVEIVKASDD